MSAVTPHTRIDVIGCVSPEKSSTISQGKDSSLLKMALALASFADRSYEEIAAAMGVSVPAVESLLFRARKNLAAILRPQRQKGEI